MLIKLNYGPRQGEIQDIAPEAATAMLADGRATWPVADQHPDQLVSPPKADVKLSMKHSKRS
jgi:hypothetical protein